eukprot:TRINITY_DN13855_c0_g1_i3.p1 TRINITY_DN13855_c0_g1~~TRINITY_DN13855_c0_g1_i3.p1  ORF type:complete len:193 (+),score=23.00 TRINITY_DN13855_c0_g1_i3:190-768(+)
MCIRDRSLKVLSTSGNSGAPPRVQSMWRKYGQKPLKPELCSGRPNRLERLYYKCYAKYCKARLLVDQDIKTYERVNIFSRGEHNHTVQILQVSRKQLDDASTCPPLALGGGMQSGDLPVRTPPGNYPHSSRNPEETHPGNALPFYTVPSAGDGAAPMDLTTVKSSQQMASSTMSSKSSLWEPRPSLGEIDPA